MMEQDENACANKPKESDRKRFGFKPTKRGPLTEVAATPTAPIQETPATNAPVDLTKLLEDELGDLEPAKEVLRLKTVAGRFEYKEQIEELKSFNKPLKDALAERVRREESLRKALAVASKEICDRENQLKDANKSCVAKIKTEMESEIAKAKQQEAKLIAHHEKKLAEFKSNTDRVLAAAEQNQREAFANNAATLVKTQKDADERLDEERKNSLRIQKELEEKIVRCEADSKDREVKTLAEHCAKLKEVESSAQRREQELMADAAHKLKQVELRADEREGEMQIKLEQQVLISQQRIDKLALQLEAAEASANDREEDLRSQLKQAALKSNQLRDELDTTCEKLDSQERQSSALTKTVAEKEAEIIEAAQREADLKATHAAALAKVVADRRLNEDELTLQHEQQIANAQKRFDDMRAALLKDIADEKAKSAGREKELQSELATMVTETKASEQRVNAEHTSKLSEMEAMGMQREQELKAEASQKLQQAELRASEREEELNIKLQKQALQSQQRENKLSMEFEAAEASAKCREEDLSKQLKQVTLKSNQLQDDLASSEQKSTEQERTFQRKLEEANKRIQKLESDLAAEIDTREKEGSAMAALKTRLTETLKDLEQERKTSHDLKMSRDASQEKCTDLQRDLQANEQQCDRLREAVGEEQANLEKTQASLSQAETQLVANQTEIVKLTSELNDARAKTDRLSMEKRETELEYQSYKEHNSTSNQAQMEAIAELKLTVDKLSQKVDSSQSELLHKCEDVAQHQVSIRRLEEQLAHSEINRRELHNTIQELKGNIRVFCRTRPGRPEEESALSQTDDNKISLCHANENYNFNFDKVFGPSAVQEDLFNEVSSLVQSALDGYKVCIFAYGQTGSGKTYTMHGGTSPCSWGLIPRSLRQIFNTAEEMRRKGWHWCLKASFLEVYNEVLRDLLRDDATTTTPQCHTIKHDSNWGMMVTNVTSVEVTSMQQINDLMAKAAKLRAVGSTDSNAVSSRSHSIFALYLEGTNRGLDQQLHGALHLVDLAGSERLDKSHAVGDRLKETQNINRSLSSLADVFAAKAEGRAHVPFRNSKLTHLMEPCLSGHGKTLMTVNVGPEVANSHETLCSLRFASQVSQCTTGGKAKRSVKALTKAAPASQASSSTAKKR